MDLAVVTRVSKVLFIPFRSIKKIEKKVDKSLRKLNFSARPWEIMGKYMDLNWKFIECGCITVQKALEIIECLHFS